jgi:hypothetical protein
MFLPRICCGEVRANRMRQHRQRQRHPYPSSLALTGFFAQSQTHLIAPAAGAAIIFAVPLYPTNA